jgi:hypothetical protein
MITWEVSLDASFVRYLAKPGAGLDPFSSVGGRVSYRGGKIWGGRLHVTRP